MMSKNSIRLPMSKTNREFVQVTEDILKILKDMDHREQGGWGEVFRLAALSLVISQGPALLELAGNHDYHLNDDILERAASKTIQKELGSQFEGIRTSLDEELLIRYASINGICDLLNHPKISISAKNKLQEYLATRAGYDAGKSINEQSSEFYKSHKMGYTFLVRELLVHHYVVGKKNTQLA